MPDQASYLYLLEQSKQIDYLLELPGVSDDEKEELNQIWASLKSREESKFDAIVGVIKECDAIINKLEREEKEIKNSKEHWKKKRNNIINIIKMAYERKLITSKPTGNKYQATIKPSKAKLVDNFEKWTTVERKTFGLYKKTVTHRSIDDSIVNESYEDLPDKPQIRKILKSSPEQAPSPAKLVQRVSLLYGLRKRIKKGI